MMFRGNGQCNPYHLINVNTVECALRWESLCIAKTFKYVEGSVSGIPFSVASPALFILLEEFIQQRSLGRCKMHPRSTASPCSNATVSG